MSRYITRANSITLHLLRNEQADDETAVSLCGIVSAPGSMWSVKTVEAALDSRICRRCTEMRNYPEKRNVTAE